MIAWIVGIWTFLIGLAVLWFAAANGYRSLWLHLHFPGHRRNMKRAELCLEAAEHWQDSFVTQRFVSQAYRLCDECGCPADLWPVGVLKIHVGV